MFLFFPVLYNCDRHLRCLKDISRNKCDLNFRQDDLKMPDDRKRDGGGRGGLDPPRLRVANSDDPPRLQSPDSDLELSLALCPPLTAALSWGETPAPYVSTVDVDAIKV